MFFRSIIIPIIFLTIVYFFLNYFLNNNALLSILDRKTFTDDELLSINLFKLILYFFTLLLVLFYLLLLKYKKNFKNKILLLSDFFFKEYLNWTIVFLLCLIFLLILLIRFYFIIDNENPLLLLGLNEYRATQWLINYFDLGFIKKGFLGTVTKLFFNEYYAKFNFILVGSFIIQFLVVTSYIIFTKIISKNNNSDYLKLLLLFFASSPCFIFFYFTDSGRTDQLNNLLMLLCICIILYKINYFNISIVGIISFIGVLIHESYCAIQFPIIISIIFLLLYKNSNHILNSKFIKLILPIMLITLSLILLVFFGYLDTSKTSTDELYGLLSKQADFDTKVLGTFDRLPWQDFNLTNLSNSPESFIYTSLSFFISNLPFFLIVFLIWKVHLKFSNSLLFLGKILLIISCFLPLLLSQVMTFNDTYRVHASFALSLQISSIFFIYLACIDNNITKTKLNNYQFAIFGFGGLIYNVIFIIFHCFTITVSSDISPIAYLIYYLVN